MESNKLNMKKKKKQTIHFRNSSLIGCDFQFGLKLYKKAKYLKINFDKELEFKKHVENLD